MTQETKCSFRERCLTIFVIQDCRLFDFYNYNLRQMKSFFNRDVSAFFLYDVLIAHFIVFLFCAILVHEYCRYYQ